MWFPSIFQKPGFSKKPSFSAPAKPRRALRLRLEQLEDRTLPSNFTAATVSDLIADINAANQAGGTNTITLTAPTTSPYVLTAVDNTANGANGLPVIAAKDNLTIVGNGDIIERSTASGTPVFRIFEVGSGASLTTENLAVQNGLAPGSPAPYSDTGGAFLNYAGTLTVSGCTLYSNSAGVGGAIGNLGGTLTVSGCTLSANSAPGAPGGGAIFIQGGSKASVQSSTLSGNSAFEGGAIENQGTLTVGACTLSGNSANYGGAIENLGSLTITGCTLSSNSAGPGGAINDVGHNLKVSDLTVSNCAFSGNAGSVGGAINAGPIYLGFGKTPILVPIVSISDSTFSGNTATYGGAISDSSGTQTHGQLGISGCSFSGNLASLGGAVYIDQGTGVVTISSSSFVKNTATQEGGGIYITSGATVTLCDDTVQSNSATYLGGGIYIVSGATVYVDGFTVANTINNTDSSGTNGPTANIDGTYILKNC
jgi:hypothetical protein